MLNRSFLCPLMGLAVGLLYPGFVFAQAGGGADNPGSVRATLVVQSGERRLPGGKVTEDINAEEFKHTQAILIKSRFVLSAVLKDAKILELPMIRAEQTPLEWLERHVVVTVPEKSAIIMVGMRGSEKEQLTVIVNAIVDKYMELVVADEGRQKRQRLEALQLQYEKIQAKLREKRNALIDLEGDVDERKALAGESLKRIDIELHQLQLQRIETQVKLSRRKAKKGPEEEIPLLEERLEIIDAQELALREEAESLRKRTTFRPVDLAAEREEIAVLANTGEPIGAELGAIKLELAAPSRVMVISRAGGG